MYLHKTAVGAVNSKTAPESSAQNVSSKIQAQTQAAKPSASLPPVSPRSISSLIAAAGLPSDKLSASIVSFARFFSLPLKPELMAAIRRQAFAPLPQQTQPTAAENASGASAAKNREALSLAAATAESKGVELNPKGLEAFAEAVDPDWQKRQESESRRRGRRNKNENEREDEKTQSKTGAITADGLKELALESAEKASLLAILNRLPGKNGRWIVLPFSFSENGRDFFVSLRILLETEQFSSNAVCMALDIAEGSEKQWLFVMEAASGSAQKLSFNRLTVHVQPELPSASLPSFIRELSQVLDIPPERVSVKNRKESFPFESGYGGDTLCAIDEAV
ncbi:MAG: hypothetical protein LBQ82_09380 [Treponema sp.]|jgi:hypothetical protein|nr:hypothetical protein [Treponema sp.]